MALRREPTQAPIIAAYTPPPIVKQANSIIKQSITAQPAEVPKVAAPHLYGTAAQKTATLQKLNAAEIKKPVAQQVIYVKPETLAPTRSAAPANIFQPQPKTTATILDVKAPTVPTATPLITESIKANPTTVAIAKETEIVPTPQNKVPISEPVAEMVKEAAQEDESGSKINPYIIYAIIGAVLLVIFLKKKK